jgi:hypothetical protein
MKTKHTLTMIAIALVFSVGALFFTSGTNHVQAKDSAQPSSTALLPSADSDLPPGTYSTTITEADVQGFPPEFIPILVGYWETEFTAGGTYIVRKDDNIVVLGRYTSNLATLVMTDLQGALACTDEPGIATGVYRWSLENNVLVLSAVKDRCVGRQTVLTAHPMPAE